MTATRWLVTGAAGFIGSNLCDHLLKNGAHVVGLDNLSTGRQANIDRVSNSAEDGFFDFYQGDILDDVSLTKALDGVDIVVHLAAQVSVQQSIANPDETDRINTGGSRRVFEAAIDAGVRKIIYASSCAIFGDNEALPLHEGSDFAPLSPYAASKLANEKDAAALAADHPTLSFTGLRFFNIFGPWQDHNGGYAAVIPRWISLLLAGEQSIAFGDGSASRDFCHVDNVAALIARIGATSPIPGAQPYNIGTGEAISLNELYAVICDRLRAHGHTPAFSEPDFQPWRSGDILHSHGKIDHARAQLEFSPAIGLADGIDQILSGEYGLTIQRPR